MEQTKYSKVRLAYITVFCCCMLQEGARLGTEMLPPQIRNPAKSGLEFFPSRHVSLSRRTVVQKKLNL